MRIGGDEFILLFKSLHTTEEAIAITEKIIAKISQKFKLTEYLLEITVSIGVAFYSGKSMKPAELIKKADEALFQSKQSGRNTYRIV